VELYGLPGGRLVRTVTHAAPVSAVAFAPTGSDLVSGAADGSLLVTHDGGESVAMPSFPQGIRVVGFLADGRVVSSDALKRLRFYDPQRRAVLADLETPTRVMALRPSQDGLQLVTIPVYSGDLGALVLWDVEHYHAIASLEGHIGRVFTARFLPSTHEIVTAGGDGTVRRWDRATGQLRQTYRGSSVFLADATLTSDGSMVIAGGGEGVVRFWDASSGRPVWTLQAHKSHVIGIQLEGDGFVTRGFAGEISRWTLPRLAGTVGVCDDGATCEIVPR